MSLKPGVLVTVSNGAANPLPTTTTNGPLPATTDRSGSITTGGTAQTVAAANANRIGLTFQNTSDTEMRVTENGTTATAATGYLVAAGQFIRVNSNKAISVFCATTGKTFAATEF
jgi:hypothetical protein